VLFKTIVKINRSFCLHKYYVLSVMYCKLGAPTSRHGGLQLPSAGHMCICICKEIRKNGKSNDEEGVDKHAMQAVFPQRKFYTEQMFVLLRTKRMEWCNRADTPTVKRSQRQKGCAIYISGPTALNLERWKSARMG